MDRQPNFCTTGILFGFAQPTAFFLIRRHGSTLSGKRWIGRKQRLGRYETGVVYHQSVEVDDADAGSAMLLRRITIELDKPTWDGDTEIHLLNNLPSDVDTLHPAMAYLHRRKIENLFGDFRQALGAETDTLC